MYASLGPDPHSKIFKMQPVFIWSKIIIFIQLFVLGSKEVLIMKVRSIINTVQLVYASRPFPGTLQAQTKTRTVKDNFAKVFDMNICVLLKGTLASTSGIINIYYYM